MGDKKTARRKRIASGVIAGKTKSQIAREEGLSREWVSAEANSEETRQIIAGLLDKHHEQIDRCVAQALTAIEEAFTASAYKVTQLGEVVKIGPDHYARLVAVNRLEKLLVAGRPRTEPVQQKDERKPSGAEILEFLSRAKAAA